CKQFLNICKCIVRSSLLRIMMHKVKLDAAPINLEHPPLLQSHKSLRTACATVSEIEIVKRHSKHHATAGHLEEVHTPDMLVKM
ncbi:hypothetical protein AVEN_91551-1, partial [Araneus ventricosus]